MHLAIHLANLSLPGGTESLAGTIARTARTADEVGVSTLTVMDHWFQMEDLGGPAEPMLEGYGLLNFIAGQTANLTLGVLVTGVTYRHPGLLAKTVTTLDVLSEGRAILGLGAAWYEREHLGLGVPFPSVAERFERLEETLQICQQMWSDNDGPYAGQLYQLAETICVPRPIQRPGPSIMIGGGGEKKTLKLVARYADACNLFADEPRELARKLDVLRAHCDREQRDYDDIEKTVIGAFNALGDTDSFLRLMETYSALGFTKVWAGPEGPDPAAWTAAAGAQLIPRLEAI